MTNLPALARRRASLRLHPLAAQALVVSALVASAGGAAAEGIAARIAVSGEASRTVVPDLASADLGVVTEGKTATEALDRNTAAMSQVMKTLRARGIPAEDIRTRNFSITRQYRSGVGSGPPVPVGFSVSNQVSVTVRDPATLGAHLDALVGDGANQVNAVRFSIADPGPLMDELRREAIADAKRRASIYAQSAGLALGPVVSVQESGAQLPAPVESAPMLRASSAVPISPGQARVQLGVSVVFSATPR